ncbi:NAD-dependent epimerase/dehydratase family protein [Sulfitobacter aestuarii]|uniref:NAD-dependent epimerase/dehydratase family protein n=1 Tax=Sulfitobacter aestuarii TaxID=2161676 RepID=A0ABW5TZI8_9RHOB
MLGASGRLGAMVCGFWPERGDLVCHSRRALPGFVRFDPMSEPEALYNAARGARALICLSGVTPIRAAQDGDLFSLNRDLALAAVQAAARGGVGRVFLASSAAVYGNASGICSEELSCTPVSDYGKAKLAMEQAARSAARDLDQPLTILRIGNVAGADAILGNWHPEMQLDRFPDGRTPRRSYIGPESLALLLHQLTHLADAPEILNISAPGCVEMGDLLDAAGLTWTPRPAGPGAIAEVRLSTARLEALTGVAAERGEAAGLVGEWRAFAALEQGDPE